MNHNQIRQLAATLPAAAGLGFKSDSTDTAINELLDQLNCEWLLLPEVPADSGFVQEMIDKMMTGAALSDDEVRAAAQAHTASATSSGPSVSAPAPISAPAGVHSVSLIAEAKRNGAPDPQAHTAPPTPAPAPPTPAPAPPTPHPRSRRRAAAAGAPASASAPPAPPAPPTPAIPVATRSWKSKLVIATSLVVLALFSVAGLIRLFFLVIPDKEAQRELTPPAVQPAGDVGDGTGVHLRADQVNIDVPIQVIPEVHGSAPPIHRADFGGGIHANYIDHGLVPGSSGRQALSTILGAPATFVDRPASGETASREVRFEPGTAGGLIANPRPSLEARIDDNTAAIRQLREDMSVLQSGQGLIIEMLRDSSSRGAVVSHLVSRETVVPTPTLASPASPTAVGTTASPASG